MSVTKMPSHLEEAMRLEPPAVLEEICRKWGVSGLIFIDDPIKCRNSLRWETNIYLNIRGTFWDPLILPPWCCETYYEAVIMRLLHEVGHIAGKHPGDPSMRSTHNGLIFKREISPSDPFKGFLTGFEGDAWRFALGIRKDNKLLFNEMLNLTPLPGSEKWNGLHFNILLIKQINKLLRQENYAGNFLFDA